MPGIFICPVIFLFPNNPMPTLHIFNPDTDYALAANVRFYTPPAPVVKIRNALALLPAIYASEEDLILLPEDIRNAEALLYADIAGEKKLSLLRPNDLVSKDVSQITKIDPWGWNLSLKTSLSSIPALSTLLPSDERLELLRDLSHRRTASRFLVVLAKEGINIPSLPEEFSSVGDAMNFMRNNPGCYFKAPWSSSGRGIASTGDLEERHVEPWLRGIIRRQGSIMAEIGYERSIDFASEWICEKGYVRFMGLSVFEVSPRGKYHFNILAPEEELFSMIAIKTGNEFELRQILDKQKLALEAIIAPYYTGPLGIDMFATREGIIHPCVEINLRHTMGLIASKLQKELEKGGKIADMLKRIYPDRVFSPLEKY